MLCIYFHHFSLKYNPDNSRFAFDTPSRSWAEHMTAFAELQDDTPLDQLYFELANGAFLIAKGL